MFSISNWTFNIILGGQFEIKIRGVLGQMILVSVRMNTRIKLMTFSVKNTLPYPAFEATVGL